MRKDLQGHSPYGALIGTTILNADADAKEIEVGYEARNEFTNRIGTISGGMLLVTLDSVTGLAGLVALPEDRTAVHPSLKVEYLRPAHPVTPRPARLFRPRHARHVGLLATERA